VRTEVKSIRKTSPNLKDSYVEIKTAPGKTHFEAWLLNAHIAPYSHGNNWNHDPVQKRKLLLHSKQVDELHGAIIRKGMTIIPTQMYFVNGRVKVELGLGKGKKKHDKRDDLKEKSAEREMDRAQKSYRK
jgi:SsrA-binding protein